MIKYVLFVFVGLLASSYSYAMGGYKCVGRDLYYKSKVTRCHLDCRESYSTRLVKENAPECTERIKTQIEVLSRMLENSQADVAQGEIQAELEVVSGRAREGCEYWGKLDGGWVCP